ncbi:DEAD/DEAH box helicase [Mechercharimyces sp. CAU 1602]|uniref:DEAD/DEAH box helicase n=1 Tax=Mechercharimyces sp. CAU 1602 TaxID=2973933 RepID=UPI0021626A2A|nr:DEAD/DEAH box helicase [Mechercharimyces sp. CAU 1602]MCS1350712.1 DEAD/DEAH box helicase [Mechercharimyces sp. CAU 1602]
MDSVPIRFDRSWLHPFYDCVETDGGWSSWERYQVALTAAELQLVRDFNHLKCLDTIQTFTPLPHQIEAAQRVIGDMRGRAILGDEVGLGKTIEAGLILKEYLLRGLVTRALILVPSSLVLQWTRELNQKFHIPAVAHKKAWMWEKHDIIVASIDTAKRSPHRDYILAQPYDFLLIDEAHKLKNRRTKNWQFISQLQKKYCLLLTATPVQNELSELYNLVTILKPGHLGAQESFQHEYVAGKRKPKNEELLRAEIQRVMIRNRRQDGNIHFTKRHVHTIPIQLSVEERELYDGITNFVRSQAQKHRETGSNILSLVLLQREVCSSRDAAFLTLFKLFQREEGEKDQLSPEVQHLVHLLRAVKNPAKVKRAVSLIQSISDKVILFTEYRATQEMVLRSLKEAGISAVPFRGGFNRNKKDWMMEFFQNRAQVMVATEAGGEGVNLQFCHHMINYDMPWNPMRVEQRIGRVHRFGQTKDVHIYNFATVDTIEEKIIWLLHEKIDLFRMVIGDLETILEKLDLKDTLEKNLMQIVMEADTESELQEKLAQLGNQFHHSKQEITPIRH